MEAQLFFTSLFMVKLSTETKLNGNEAFILQVI
jgi:hypothetical protein